MVRAEGRALSLERVKGIEPSYAAWEAAVLPLNYTRNAPDFIGNACKIEKIRVF